MSTLLDIGLSCLGVLNSSCRSKNSLSCFSEASGTICNTSLEDRGGSVSWHTSSTSIWGKILAILDGDKNDYWEDRFSTALRFDGVNRIGASSAEVVEFSESDMVSFDTVPSHVLALLFSFVIII